MGGLGNQFFQYAYGRALAYRNRTTLKLDISWYDSHPKRRYSLDQFKIAATTAGDEDIGNVLRRRNGVLGKVDAGLQRLKPYYKRRYVRERVLSFDPNIARLSHDAYLVGYWGSPRYFSSIAEVLRAELTLAYAMDSTNASYVQQIMNCNSVSVHVRRGDYVEARQQALFGLLPVTYYQRAIHYLATQLKDPHFFVFSDDIEWCRESIQIDYAHDFVSSADGNADYIDFTLLNSCRHHIIANSTFSWWGAWLSQWNGRVVVAPRQWYADSRYSAHDLVPEEWIRF